MILLPTFRKFCPIDDSLAFGHLDGVSENMLSLIGVDESGHNPYFGQPQPEAHVLGLTLHEQSHRIPALETLGFEEVGHSVAVVLYL